MRTELITLQLNEVFRIAHGSSNSRLVVRVHWMDAVGEAPFVPYYPESATDTLHWLEQWNPQPNWDGAIPQNTPRAAKLALDVLWHDFESRRLGLPLWSHLGLPNPDGIRACRSLSIPTDMGEFADKVGRLHRQFGVLKLKLGSGNPDFDEAIVATARENAPGAELFADVNGGWSINDATQLLSKLERYQLSFIEQPIHHDSGIEGWRELAANRTAEALPLFADESVQNVQDLGLLAGLIQGVNIKLRKCGSFQGALELIKAARSLELKTLLGCMIESNVGITAAAHLGGMVDWIDLDGALYVANNDYSGVEFDSKGMLRMPTHPGIGVQSLL